MNAADPVRQISVFISSPSDVVHERDAVDRVVDRLNTAYAAAVHIRAVRWERDYYTADSTFQDQIENPAACDLVVCILWSRLGKALPPDFERMPDGNPYPSGTVYEVLKALEGKRERGLPDVLVYRKRKAIETPPDDPAEAERIKDEIGAVHRFWTERFVSEQGHFLAGYHSFTSTDEFERQLEDHLRKWLGDHDLLCRPITWPLVEKGSPFRGLEAFDVEHERVMFGRADETERALGLIQKGLAAGAPFLLITGESGTGKSSLARAGIIPRAMRLPGADGADVWRLARMRPGGGPDPIRVLAAALFGAGALPELAQSDYPRPEQLRDLLARADAASVLPVARTLERVGAAWAAQHGVDRKAQARLVLLVDQLEELFSTGIEPAARETFAALCAALVSCGAVVLITTLRADAYPLFISSPALLDLKQAGATLDLRSADKAQINDIVTLSAQAAGLDFERDAGSGQRLSQALIEDAAGQDALPLLQFALQQLYQAMETRLATRGKGLANAAPEDLVLRFADYRAFGGLEGAVKQTAERAYESVDAAAQATLPRLVRALLRQNDAGYTLQSAALSQFARDPAALALIEALTKARILVRGAEERTRQPATDHPAESAGAEGRDARIRFAHEAVQRSWTRVTDIVAASAAFYRVRADVLAAFARWSDARQRGQRADDFLIQRGVPLAEAERIATEFKNELEPEVLSFIERSAARARRQLRRVQAAAAAFAVVALAAAGTAVYAFGQKSRADAATTVAQEQLDRAHIAQSRFLATQAERLSTTGDAGTAVALALEALPDDIAHPSRPIEPTAEAALARGMLLLRERLVVAVHGDTIMSAVFSPDGRRIATASLDGTARVWDARTGAPITPPLRHLDSVFAIAFSPGGTRVVTSSLDRTARIWDAETGTPIGLPLRHRDTVRMADFSPDGARVVTASADRTAQVWDVNTGQPIGPPLAHAYDVWSAYFSPDGKRIVTAADDNMARIWDAATGQPIGPPLRHTDNVRHAMFSPDGTRVVTTSADGTAQVWDAATGKPIGAPLRHTNGVVWAEWSRDGTRVVTASDDHTAQVWDAKTGQPVGKPLRHDEKVGHASFSPDGTRVLTTSEDGTARIWDAATGAPLGPPLRHDKWVSDAHFSADGTRIVTASADRTARIWDPVSGEIGMPLAHDDDVVRIAVSPDGTRAVTAARDGKARVWNLKQGGPPLILAHTDAVLAATFSPDGRRVVTASIDQTARIWDARTGRPITPPLRHEGWVTDAAFSPDGARVVTASRDRSARLWDAATGAEIGLPMRHDEDVWSARFSPDGARVVTASWDNTARIWDAATGQPVGPPLRHQDVVFKAVFSPDGKSIVTASQDGTARIWSADSGQPIGAPLTHKGAVYDAAFTPDGARIVTGSDDGTAQIWDARTGAALLVPLRHEKAVRSVAVSADGQRIVTASDDRTARVWDARTGVPLTPPLRHDGTVNGAVFTPDGDTVLTASDDHTARRWPSTLAAIIALARADLPRCLSAEQRALYFLDAEPPAWCTTLRKWPYDGRALRPQG